MADDVRTGMMEALPVEESVSEVKGKEKKKKEESLVGRTIVLDPRQGGMFVFDDISLDGKSALVLTTFDGGIDKFEVKSDMNQTTIIRGIRTGILRVHDKNGKDVSLKFGGKQRFNPFKPIVTTAPKPVNEEQDRHLLDVLNTNNLESIKDRVMMIRDRDVLNRLKELEEKGENPAATSREYVLNVIDRMKKSLPGADSTVTVTNESTVEIR